MRDAECLSAENAECSNETEENLDQRTVGPAEDDADRKSQPERDAGAEENAGEIKDKIGNEEEPETLDDKIKRHAESGVSEVVASAASESENQRLSLGSTIAGESRKLIIYYHSLYWL